MYAGRYHLGTESEKKVCAPVILNNVSRHMMKSTWKLLGIWEGAE